MCVHRDISSLFEANLREQASFEFGLFILELNFGLKFGSFISRTRCSLAAHSFDTPRHNMLIGYIGTQ